jgi:hypothetical protein
MIVLTRRSFLQTTALAAAAPAGQPKRIAILANGYPPHMADRLLIGYPYGGAWHKPDVRVVSFYQPQPVADLTRERAREFEFALYPTVAEALRCGGKTLAVDAVLIFAGPSTDLLAPCIATFQQDGRAVPVFHDGQLPGSFKGAKVAVDAARRLRFPLLAGSSLPVTWRLPAIDLPLGCQIEEALMVGEGEAMDFHALEALQCMVERRRGGETGVKAVQLLEGDAVWKAGDEGRYSKVLLTSALSRSDTQLGLTVKDGRTQDLVASGELRNLAKDPKAYCIEYRDGLRATLLMLDGAIQDFNFAGRLSGPPGNQSTQFLRTPEPNATHSACLMHKVEEMIASGAAPYPVDRTLLVGGILESGRTSKLRQETPQLAITYTPPRQSQFAQA